MSSELQSKSAFEASVLGFIYRQFTRPKPLPTGTPLGGQVAILTGGNVGIGLEASRQLLELGLSHLVMGARSQVRGDAAAARLRKEFPRSTVSVWIVDMESYDSIRAFADKCKTLPRIDIAILSAALQKSSFTTVPATGYETTMQVDYLGTALLSILLLPVLKAKKSANGAKAPVLSLVGSDLHYQAEMETKGPVLKQFNKPEAFGQLPWYGKAKLLLTLFVAKLAEYVDPDDVLINMANPGMTKGTEIFRESPNIFLRLMAVLQALLARSPSVAATTYVDAVVTQGRKSHGSFTSDWAIKP